MSPLRQVLWAGNGGLLGGIFGIVIDGHLFKEKIRHNVGNQVGIRCGRETGEGRQAKQGEEVERGVWLLRVFGVD